MTDDYYVSIADLPLSPDYYKITVFNIGNVEIYPSEDSKLFKLLKANSSIDVPEIEEFEYPHEYDVKVEAENLTTFSVIVYDCDGNIVFMNENLSGIWFGIPVLPVGHYNLTVINNGDENHSASEDSTIFNILKDHVFASFLTHDVVYGNPSVFEVMVDDHGGKYTIDINGSLIRLVFDGSAVTNVSKRLPAGNYEATLTYDDANYKIIGTTSINFNVLKAENNLDVRVDDVIYGEPTLIIISADADGNYTLDINGTIFDVEVKNRIGYNLIYLDAGSYAAKVSFDNPNYNTDVVDVEFTVRKVVNEVLVSAYVQKEAIDSVNITITADVDGIYVLNIGGVSKLISVECGKGSTYCILPPRTYEANASFDNPNYETHVTNASFEIFPFSRDIRYYVGYGENNTVIISLEANIDGIYIMNVSGNYYPLYVANGKGNISLPLEEGNYSLGVVLNDDGIVNNIDGVKEFEVVYPPAYSSRTPTNIVFKDMKTVAISPADGGKTGEYFIWRLVDENGNPMANAPMQIGFNGVVYTYEKDGICTDENGYAKLQINLGYKGVYTFAVCFLGDDDYNASFVVAKITVDTQKGTLLVPNKSYAASAKIKTLTVTFKTAKGNPIAGKWVTFKVNGKTYKAQTNAKGLASVNVSLNKKGTYSFTAKFAGDSTYTAVNKTGKLTIN